MHVWLVTIGEPLPIDSNDPRLLRVGILADTLVANGHKVSWWTSTFNHAQKEFYFQEDTFIKVSDMFSLNLLHSIPYRKNISIRRILHHSILAKKFTRFSKFREKPDIIISSFPIPELCFAASLYGIKNNVPIVLDIRDLWPDYFLDFFPISLRWIAKLLLLPMYRKIRFACRYATAFIGPTDKFVEWGLSFAKRKKNSFDRCVPFAYPSKEKNNDVVDKGRNFWDGFCINDKKKEFIICFFGNLGSCFDIELIIEAAKRLHIINKKIRFVICGTGENLSRYRAATRGISNILFPGWVTSSQILVLMQRSSLGLAPYKDSKSFFKHIPNKPIEYLSHGLPILSSLQGCLKLLLESNDCGMTYENGNLAQFIYIVTFLSENPDKLRKMSENAVKLYKEQFVAEKVYNDLAEHLLSMVNALKH